MSSQTFKSLLMDVLLLIRTAFALSTVNGCFNARLWNQCRMLSFYICAALQCFQCRLPCRNRLWWPHAADTMQPTPPSGWAEWGQCVRSSERARPPRAQQQRRVQSQTNHCLRLSLALCLKEPNKPVESFCGADAGSAATKDRKKKTAEWIIGNMRKLRARWKLFHTKNPVCLTCYKDKNMYVGHTVTWRCNNDTLWLTCFCGDIVSRQQSHICFTAYTQHMF